MINIYRFFGVCLITPFAALALIFTRIFMMIIDVLCLPIVIDDLVIEAFEVCKEKENKSEQ